MAPVEKGMKTKLNRHKYLALTLVAAPTLISVLPVAARPALSGKRSVQSGSWVELQTSTDKLTYAPGETILVTLKATNIQEKDVYLKFPSGQRFDYQIFKVGDKEPVYTWSAYKNFLQASSTLKLKLAERETYNTHIGKEMLQLSPGHYRLQAHLTNSSQIRARAIDFSVVSSSVLTPGKKATLTATTDKQLYRIGEEVKVNFSLQNNATKPIIFNFRSGQTYDVFIKNAAGESIWNWSANKRFLMVSRPIKLVAGEKSEFSTEWDGQALPDFKVTPGKYTVYAVYASDPEVKAPPIAIEIR